MPALINTIQQFTGDSALGQHFASAVLAQDAVLLNERFEQITTIATTSRQNILEQISSIAPSWIPIITPLLREPLSTEAVEKFHQIKENLAELKEKPEDEQDNPDIRKGS
jgi:hypothetical protein